MPGTYTTRPTRLRNQTRIATRSPRFTSVAWSEYLMAIEYAAVRYFLEAARQSLQMPPTSVRETVTFISKSRAICSLSCS